MNKVLFCGVLSCSSVYFFATDAFGCTSSQQKMIELELSGDSLGTLNSLCEAEDIGCDLLQYDNFTYSHPDPLVLAFPFKQEYGTFMRFHNVRRGESWQSISHKYDVSKTILMQANPDKVRASGVLYRDETLVIPGSTYLQSYGKATMYCS